MTGFNGFSLRTSVATSLALGAFLSLVIASEATADLLDDMLEGAKEVLDNSSEFLSDQLGADDEPTETVIEQVAPAAGQPAPPPVATPQAS